MKSILLRDPYTFKMSSIAALNHADFAESKMKYIKDIYENGPKNDDPNSLILAEHFAHLRQEELELKQKQNYAEIVAADFTEDAQASLRRIEQAVQDGCLDTELWFTNNLFKCVSRQFSRVVAVNSPEPWIPFAKLVSNKITEINIRDFDQHPSQPFICELRTQCHKAEVVINKFLECAI